MEAGRRLRVTRFALALSAVLGIAACSSGSRVLGSVARESAIPTPEVSATSDAQLNDLTDPTVIPLGSPSPPGHLVFADQGIASHEFRVDKYLTAGHRLSIRITCASPSHFRFGGARSAGKPLIFTAACDSRTVYGALVLPTAANRSIELDVLPTTHWWIAFYGE